MLIANTFSSVGVEEEGKDANLTHLHFHWERMEDVHFTSVSRGNKEYAALFQTVERI